ncbi:MAG: NADH-ubiquinone oxidoreductase-F iron-sulfur binding region domain-containing protein [Candidatus Gastranaerophilaceae bacterium]
MEKTALTIDIKEEQKKAQELIKQQGRRILVCASTGCIANGALEIIEKFKKLGADVNVLNKADKLSVIPTGCIGFCEQGVLVVIPDKKLTYVHVKEEDVEEIYNSVQNDTVVERLLYVDPALNKKIVNNEEMNFYAKQTRTALKNCGHINPESLDEAIAAGAYSALSKVLTEMDSEAVIKEIEDSGLRGRGGGGFATGKKWRSVYQHRGGKSFVICNGDEGDPGAFMDRSVMEDDPHKLLEGMAIAAFAVGSDEGYIYVRAEYPLAIKRLKMAINAAEERNLLGNNIMGSNFSFHIHIKEGAGAFVCGESSALIASIEGERGMPRPKNIHMAECGLFKRPTLLNNVETFANVPLIILNGSAWFNSMGTEKSKGTKTFALTGEVNNTGLIEIPMDTTLRQIVFDLGGGIRNNKKFKAVQIGGPSGGCLTEEHLDMPMDYDQLTKVGAMVGSGGLVVMNEDTCIVEVARFFMNFTCNESCGKCTPCREGTKQMLAILERIVKGEGKMEDLDTLEELGRVIKDASLCGLGKSAPNPVLSTLKYFRDEYVAHIKDKKCPAGVCKALKHYEIDEEKCKGCTKCARNCPVGAIEGNIKEAHKINQEKCIKCGACISNCPFKAITQK